MARRSRSTASTPPPVASGGYVLLPVGLLLTTVSHLLDGFAGGLLLGAGLALVVLSAVLLGATLRRRREAGQGWLPSRDGDGR